MLNDTGTILRHLSIMEHLWHSQAERLGAAIRLWFVLREAKQIAHQDNDRDLSDCRHIYRSLLLDVGIEVLW